MLFPRTLLLTPENASAFTGSSVAAIRLPNREREASVGFYKYPDDGHSNSLALPL